MTREFANKSLARKSPQKYLRKMAFESLFLAKLSKSIDSSQFLSASADVFIKRITKHLTFRSHESRINESITLECISGTALRVPGSVFFNVTTNYLQLINVAFKENVLY